VFFIRLSLDDRFLDAGASAISLMIAFLALPVMRLTARTGDPSQRR
jgi:hypothetical protein